MTEEEKNQLAYGKTNGSWRFFKPSEISHAYSIQTGMSSLKKNDKVALHPEQGATIDEHRRQPYSVEKKEEVEKKHSGVAELRWPSLPGEFGAENVSEYFLSAPAWPSLPEEQSIGMMLAMQQMKTRSSEVESVETDRLVRLDDEQKGTTWSE
jgi:hypothetical protein